MIIVKNTGQLVRIVPRGLPVVNFDTINEFAFISKNSNIEYFTNLYQTVPTATSSFLAEKRIAKKRLNRELDGVNDLFASAIADIQRLWQPTNFKWVAVPELHKCQVKCHWQGKKSKKKGWKNHNQKLCHCPTKHDCLRNWHIHMLSTDFLPTKYAHKNVA